MDYECTLREIEAQPIMSIRGPTTTAAIATTIGEFLGEVWNYVQANGGAIAGPPFTRYHGVAGDTIELEAGLPVDAAIPGAGRVIAGELPAGPMVATMHIGPYEELPQAGAALFAWASAHGRTPAGPNWELYWTDPGEVSDPAQWKTEVIMPLKPI